MIKKIAWEAFKNTGDINTYLELKQIEDLEEKIEKNDLNIETKNVFDKENFIDKENVKIEKEYKDKENYKNSF